MLLVGRVIGGLLKPLTAEDAIGLAVSHFAIHGEVLVKDAIQLHAGFFQQARRRDIDVRANCLYAVQFQLVESETNNFFQGFG